MRFTSSQHGSSAQRQLATYARTGDLRAVVDQLITETAEGVCDINLGPALDRVDAPMTAAKPGTIAVPVPPPVGAPAEG